MSDYLKYPIEVVREKINKRLKELGIMGKTTIHINPNLLTYWQGKAMSIEKALEEMLDDLIKMGQYKVTLNTLNMVEATFGKHDEYMAKLKKAIDKNLTSKIKP